MPIKDCKTEALILDTAMKIFFTEGRLHVTTQDIADAAGVNRTLINYYFRSKDELFRTVVKKSRKEYIKNADAILSTELPLREKTEMFIDNFMAKLFKYPYLESFITLDIIQNRLKKSTSSGRKEKQPVPVQQYLKEIKIEMDKGRIPSYNPAHFILNLFSLMIYPMIMKPVQMNLLNLDENEYQKVLDERKQIILNILFPVKTDAKK